MEIIDLRPMPSAPSMAHQSVCWAAQALQSPLFGVWNVAKKLSEMGTIARAGFYSMMTQSK
jgi:hypothetical protein